MEHDPTLDRYLAHDRHVRSVARSLLFDEHRVDDVVQETWLSTIGRKPRNGDRLRAWLAGIVRNLAKKSLATERALGERERAAAKAEATPSAAEMAALEEARHRIAGAVIALAEPYRTALWLRFFEDLPPRKIGIRLGVPAETARTWVKRGLEQVRAALDQQYSGRGAWCLALVPLAAAAPSLGIGAGAAALAKTTYSSLAMASTQVKVGIAAAVVAAFVAALWTIERTGAHETQLSPSAPARADGVATAPRPEGASVASVETQLSGAASRAAAGSKPAESAPKPNDPFATLVVHFRWAKDKTPAAGVGVRLHPTALDNTYFAGPTARADATGTVRFERIPAGSAWLRLDRWFGESVRVKGGELNEITKDIPDGATLEVSVVGPTGAAVEGAEVYLNEQGVSPWSVGKTDNVGKLRVPSFGSMNYYVSACAPDFAPSKQILLMGAKDGVIPIKLELPGAGGAVEGRVVDKDGKSIPNVTVLIGETGDNSGGFRDIADPLPAKLVSDELGRFRAIGLAPGKNGVAARTAGFAPWRGSVEVPSSGAAPLEIALGDGVTLLGTITDEEGKPVKGADLSTGAWGTITNFTTSSRDDGSYALSGLPAEEISLRVSKDKVGKSTFTIRGNPGASVRHDVVLGLGLKIWGRVVDSQGNGIKGVPVDAFPSDGATNLNDSGGMTFTDGTGRFSVDSCKDVPHRVTVRSGLRGGEKRLENVKPGREELTITIEPEEKGDCMIVGQLVDSQQKPIAAAQVVVSRVGSGLSPIDFADGDGKFKIGPLPAGTYAIHIGARDQAAVRFPLRALKPGDTWDMGTVVLGRPEFLTVRYHFASGVEGQPRPVFDLIDAQGPWASGGFEALAGKSAKTSTGVAPGAYTLQISGGHTAAAQVPVTIEAGRENVVDVEVAAGVEQKFHFEIPKKKDLGNENPRLTVRNAAGAVVDTTVLWQTQGAPAQETVRWYAPGEYRYEVTTTIGLGAAGSFRVGAAPGEPVAAELH